MNAFKHLWCIAKKAQYCVCILLLVLATVSCKQSDISERFKRGAGKQEGLDSSSLLLFDRSPSEASGGSQVLATSYLDRLVEKSSHTFSGILDVQDNLRSDFLIMQKSHFNLTAPTFFTWAGRDVIWENNSDYRAFFTYHYANQVIEYVDLLKASLKTDLLLNDNEIAWKENMEDGAGDFKAPNVFPLLISYDNDVLPGGASSLATDTNYCPIFNTNYRVNGQGSCLAWSSLNPVLIEDAFTGSSPYLYKKISFYRDVDMPEFNNADDGDVVFHEMFHVVQDAIIPEVLASSSGINVQMDAIIEGSADFFVSAMNKDNNVARYHQFNLHSLIPEAFIGSFDGSTRDTDNTLTFPNAYLDSPHDLGRTFSGAMYDLVWTLSGNTLSVFPDETVCPFAHYAGDATCEIQMGTLSIADAYDEVMKLVILTFLSQEGQAAPEDVTFHGFSKLMIVECASFAWCDTEGLSKILEARGLKTIHDWSNDSGTPAIVAAATNLSAFSDVDNPAPTGINLPATLGWAPFMPGGVTSFANDDANIDPCEAIIIFPNVTNSSNLLALGAGLSAAANAVWNAGTTNAKFRGVPIYEIIYKLTAVPTGVSVFDHPTLGEIEPWYGYEAAGEKGIPYLAPGESIQELTLDEEGRLFGVYGNKEFDSPQTTKSANGAAEAYKLKTPIGWLFEAPGTAGNQMEMSFSIKYKVFDSDTLVEVDSYLDTAPNPDQTLTSITQSLEVDDTPNTFCGN